MPEFVVGVYSKVEVKIEADTHEEAKALAIVSPALLDSAKWEIDYCFRLRDRV